ncbi:hypothetical protein SAMN06265350_101565 [Solitalea koreensis]|uniref:DUF6249 domain-containing protein n=2 Tax=Solitalea koreensis TaxID=543615 RepID=A0A521B036_9SPHI|nr:hypothetical protein SAMN06265350_101565 [Solitalea koreensis]
MLLTIETWYKSTEGIIQLIGIAIAFLALYIPFINYVIGLRKKNEDNRFAIYHKLIEEFAGADKAPKLDRQIAIVFELGRFPEYYPVSRRILVDWKALYLNKSNRDHKRLEKEIDLTISNMDSYKSSRALKWGLLIIGVGIGLLSALILTQRTFVGIDEVSQLAIWFAMILICGGIGLIVFYWIEKPEKNAKGQVIQ